MSKLNKTNCNSRKELLDLDIIVDGNSASRRNPEEAIQANAERCRNLLILAKDIYEKKIRESKTRKEEIGQKPRQ